MKDPDQPQDVIIANKLDTWPRIVKDNKPKRNVTTVKRLVTFPEIALKEVTKRKVLNVTNAMKLDILPENAAVNF